MNHGPFRHVDLFAGVGGFTFGLETTSQYKSVLLADSDRSAARTLKRNRPRIPYWVQDLAQVGADDILERARLSPGELDLLTAGPPCQGFSRNRGRSLDDPRNALLGKTAALIVDLKPKAAVIENVPPLFYEAHNRAFEDLMEVLLDAGYDVFPKVLDAWRHGVPQMRRRLFVVAVRSGLGLADQDPFPAGLETNGFFARDLIAAAETGEPECPPGLSVEEAIGDLPPLDPGGGREVATYPRPPASDYQRARRARATFLVNHRSRTHSEGMVRNLSRIPEGGRNHEMPDGERLRAQDGEYYSQAYARLHRHGIAQTVTTYFHNPGSGRFIHYRDDRAITVREAARFQSFDDDIMFLGTSEQQTRHVGNAVPPLLAAATGDRIAQLLDQAAPDQRHTR